MFNFVCGRFGFDEAGGFTSAAAFGMMILSMRQQSETKVWPVKCKSLGLSCLSVDVPRTLSSIALTFSADEVQRFRSLEERL